MFTRKIKVVYTSKLRSLSFLILLFFSLSLSAQKRSQDVFVDKNGVMRWDNSNEEVRAFGINYTAMFAHAFRTAKKLNISLEKAIDDDVYHFARLGFDAFRVHVWDTEISDSVGNLLNNDHLKLFDYALSKMQERGMKFVITPIAYWGNGWPEPDEKTPGFSRKYGKGPCLTNPEAIKAQEIYLFQFLNHVNSYTGIAYKSDPDIIGFEVSNEPHHGEAAEKVTEFINRMVKSMRNTGCKKPIFYNISHSIHLVDAYFNSNIQGGTFQWYPTGLGAGHELKGNLLPNVDQYAIPFAARPKFKKMAKIVYEFDAADVGRSYIYPAMARSFREAGMQIATHFAYDPTFMADVNTEYGTHYMNLAYAPQKALSLMIASEVFHEIPMYKNYGQYPDNATFGNFRVSYEKDLAEMISEKKFLYTNTTNSVTPAPDKLQKIAGFGNSTVVRYEGQGAYFLDRIEEGVWRLEVMPDAVWINDPFEKTSPRKKVAVIAYKNWPMTIDLPALGKTFSVKAINEGNSRNDKVTNGAFIISPGTYFLIKEGTIQKISPDSRWKNIVLKEFVAPKHSLNATTVLHQPLGAQSAGTPYTLDAQVVSPDTIQSAELYAWLQESRPEVFGMKRTNGNFYSATIPGERVQEGFLRYQVVVKSGNRSYTFPSGLQTHPRDWDFYDDNSYKIAVIAKDAPVYLFNAITDTDDLTRQWIRNSALIPSDEPGKAELKINVEKLSVTDSENSNGVKTYDYSIRYFAGTKIAGRKNEIIEKKKIILHGRSSDGKPSVVQVALVNKDGEAYGGLVTLESELKDCSIALSDLKKVKLVSLPRPYPTFLPYYFENVSSKNFDISELESVQLSIGPGIPEDELQKSHGISIESIRLE